MKKLMILAIAMMVGIMACGSCAHKSQTEVVTHPADGGLVCTETGCPLKLPESGPVSDVIAEDNWQFTLTGDGWTPIKSQDDSVKVALQNDQLKMVVFMVKDPTSETPAQYLINTIRTVSAAGLKTSAAKQVTINGNNFVMLTSSGGNTVWTWLDVKGGFAYVFGCSSSAGDGGAEDQQRCQDIANTLQIQ